MNVTNSTAKFLQRCYINADVYTFVVKFPSTQAFATYFAACIFSLIIIITTVALNSLTVLTFWRIPRLRENVSMYFIMILSLVDAGTGFFCYPTLTISLIFELIHNPQCWIIDFQAKFFRATSVLSLSVVSAISLERYFGVVYPLIHRTKITKSKLSQLFVIIWMCCGIISLPVYFTENPFNLFATVSCAFLIIITLFSYTRIAYTILLPRMRRVTLAVTDGSSNAEDGDSTWTKNRNKILQCLKELKMAKSCFLIVLCYFLCYAPSLIVLGGLRGKISNITNFYAKPWCLISLMLNSCLNSIIFFWRSAPLRKETKNVLKDIKLKCT